MAESQNGISIIVCCYNGIGRIEKAIEHLVAQQLAPGIPWEIIIVDNASTDDTYSCAQAQLQEHFEGGNFIVVQEMTAGLSHARKKGIATAKYEYIIFCDDDNWLPPTYAQQVFDMLSKHDELGIVGGRGLGVYGKEKPVWFERLEKSYAIGEQAKGSMEVKGVWGAGMGLRKSAYDRLFALGFKHLNSDRVKETLAVGGDTEICLALSRMGYRIWYEESLVFQHFVPAERINLDYAKNLYYYIGYAAPTITVYNEAFESNTKKGLMDYWIIRLGKSVAQLILLSCRPASSIYFKDPFKVVKSFFIQNQKGKTTRLLQMRWHYDRIIREIRNSPWNTKKG